MTYDHFEAMKRHHKAHVKKQGKKRNIDTRSLDLLPVTSYSLNDFDKTAILKNSKDEYHNMRLTGTDKKLGNRMHTFKPERQNIYLQRLRAIIMEKHRSTVNNQAYPIDVRKQEVDVAKIIEDRTNKEFLRSEENYLLRQEMLKVFHEALAEKNATEFSR